MALPNAPQSRNEKYLAKIAGQEVELPNEPLSREEQYLEYIATHGGGGGSSLEAGDYIDITAGVISVKKEKGEYLLERYVLQSTGTGVPKLVVKKYIDSELISTNEYENNTAHVNIDDTLEIWYSYNPYNWHYKLLTDGVDHSTGYEYEFSYDDTTEYPVDFHIEAGDSTDLVTKADLVYANIPDKPSVNGVELSGNKTASDLGLVAAPVVNLDNGMVSHSTDTSYITVDLDVPLTALKQYSVTLKDPSSNYIETLKVLWNGTVDLIFPGNASTSGTYRLTLLEETVKLINYGGYWRDIYCTIEEAAEDEHELKTLHLSSDATNDNGVRGTGLNIEDVVIVGVSSGDSSSDLMWNLGMKNVSGGKHEYTIRFFIPSGESCANMNFWADVFYYDR